GSLVGEGRGAGVPRGAAGREARPDRPWEGRVVPAAAADHDGDGGLLPPRRAHDASGHGAHPPCRGEGESCCGLLGEVVRVVEQARHRDLLLRCRARLGRADFLSYRKLDNGDTTHLYSSEYKWVVSRSR